MFYTNKLILYLNIFLSIILILIDYSYGITQYYWDIILLIIVLSFGIVHGCFDLIIQNSPEIKGLVLSNIIYLSKIIFYLLIWWYFPKIAFIIFILITIFHFGETDMTILNLKRNNLNSFLFGLSIVSWFVFSKSYNIHYSISKLKIFNMNDIFFLHQPIILNTLGITAIIIMLYYLISNKVPFFVYFFYTLLFYIIFKLSLSQSFVLYFGFWHSIQTLSIIKNEVGFCKNNNFKKMLVYLIITYIIIFVALFVIFNYIRFSIEDLNLFLILIISTLSLPHIIIMHKLYRKITWLFSQ